MYTVPRNSIINAIRPCIVPALRNEGDAPAADRDEAGHVHPNADGVFLTRALLEPLACERSENTADLPVGGFLMLSRSDNRPSILTPHQFADMSIYIGAPGLDGGLQYIDIMGYHGTAGPSGRAQLVESLTETIPEQDTIAGVRDVAADWRQNFDDLLSDLQHMAQQGVEVPARLLEYGALSSMLDSYGNSPLANGLTQDQLFRHTRALALRSSIARTDANHPDALGAAFSLSNVLAHPDVGSQEFGAFVRESVYRGQSAHSRRAMQATDRLCRELFGAVTSTPIEELQVSQMAPQTARQINQAMAHEGCQVDAAWSQAVIAEMHRILADVMPGYQSTIEIHQKNGVDILTVQDMRGGYAYSWPSESRRPVMDIGDHQIVAVMPDEVPSHEELERLETVARELLDRGRDDDLGMRM